MIAPEAIVRLRAELGSAQALHSTRTAAFQDLAVTLQTLNAEKSEIDRQLSDLRRLLLGIEARTVALKDLVALKKSAAVAAESRLLEKEKKVGIAGIAPDAAIKQPKTVWGSTSGLSSTDEQYLELRRREVAGEVPNGTAFKFWRAANHNRAGSSTSTRQQSGRRTWGERIVSGVAD